MDCDLATNSDPASTVLTDIVARHAQQAPFLWHLRDAAVRSPAYDLESLQRLDDRVDAHLDGLRIAGDIGWGVSRAALPSSGGEAFAATVLAVERADVRGLAEILASGVRSIELMRGIVSALGWVPLDRAKRFLGELLAGDAPPELHYFGIAGSAVHRYHPGEPLAYAAHASDPRLRVRALRAIGEFGHAALLPALRHALGADDDACRFWAAWSGALLGEPAAKDVLGCLARGGGPFAQRACDMAMRCSELTTARGWIGEMAGEGKLRTALAGAAALGDSALVPWVIDCMAIAEQARYAGWAFSMITGSNLAVQQLYGQPPEGFQSGPTDDPEDPRVALDPDACLPWPNAVAVRSWWERNGAGIPPGRRLLLGRPIEQAWLCQVLRAGSQPARTAAAIEMASIRRGQPLFEVRAPGFVQDRILRECE